VISPAKLLDPIPPPTNKRKSSSSSSTKKQPPQSLLPNGNGGGGGDKNSMQSSSSSTTTKRKRKPLTPHERTVLAATIASDMRIELIPLSTTTTQVVEANGKISLPPPRKRARHKEVPLFVITDADQAGQIPDHTKFFLSLEDATDELHRDDIGNGKPRAMMIWRCGDRKH